jgi:hypothetical protein
MSANDSDIVAKKIFYVVLAGVIVFSGVVFLFILK